mgnify:CR=1 FL=1
MAPRLSTLHKLVFDARVLALLTGAVCTPVALGLSLQIWPVGGPLVLYALVTAVFAYQRPESGWRWGLWTGAGHLATIVLVIVGTALLADTATFPSSFVRVSVIFGLGPAVAGALLGATGVKVLSEARYELFGLVLGVLLAGALLVTFLV